ncbi:unnamed protein product [Symbiodinium sp. KB8]|nr:unnamed protein product [Symbiodinium sp. KB8]
MRLSMELLVSTLEGQADALEAVRSGMFDCKRWGFHRYDMVFLIRCLFLCSNLRSDRALRDALVASLHVLFQGSPGGEANYFIEILGDSDFPVPSPSTLGHMRFVLDCVAMLQMRKYHEKVFAAGQPKPALFFLLDSSPQGNVNWLMIEYFLVEGNKLQGLCADAWRLHKLGRVRWQDDPDEERVAEERGLVERLTSVVQHHVLPPVGLGSGRSSLQYEHHALLHALFLETGNFELMCAVASQTTAIASDKGDSFVADDGDGLNEGIADAMPSFWDDVYPGMNALINCLSAKFFRQRFAATCFRASEIACGQFESFITAITDMELAEARAHPLTKRFCEQGPLNSELLDFLNGQDRSELPLVMQEAGRLLLVPVNEISVERLHAQTRKELKRGPAAGADYDKISKQIVYHLDLQSQFLPSNPAFNKTSGRGSGAEGAVSLEDLRQQLLLEKFRQVHAPGTFYTIRKAYAADVLVADELPVFHVNSRPQESATDLMFQADGDAGVDVDSAVPGPVQNHAEVAPPAKDRDLFIAFQVLNIKPSAKKYALCDTGKELQVTDIAVSQHRVLNLDTVAKELEVSMEPGSDSKAWSRMLTARALSSCYAWSAKTGSLTAALQESLAADVASEELLQHIRRCVSMLYLARAVPNTTNYVPANTLQESFNDALDFLLSKGCVLRSDGLCQLTSRGLEALQLTQVLVEPTALLSLEADTPARKRSASALLHFLVEKGWSLQHVNPRRAVEPLGPFSEASPPSSKTIVIKETRKTIDREYMLALVLVEDSRHRKKLLDIGINSIEHLMPLPFYVALNNADEAALQAMLMEADAGDDEVDLAQRFQRVRQGWRRKAGYRRGRAIPNEHTRMRLTKMLKSRLPSGLVPTRDVAVAVLRLRLSKPNLNLRPRPRVAGVAGDVLGLCQTQQRLLLLQMCRCLMMKPLQTQNPSRCPLVIAVGMTVAVAAAAAAAAVPVIPVLHPPIRVLCVLNGQSSSCPVAKTACLSILGSPLLPSSRPEDPHLKAGLLFCVSKSSNLAKSPARR